MVQRVWDEDERPKAEEMPTVLPLFPLDQPLLLPGTVVPFAAESPADRNLVDDALAADRYVAIVQPLEDAALAARPQEGPPAIYSVGCVGYIGECHETDVDRYLVLAGGLIRFRVLAEEPTDRGYRRVVVDYGEFAGDPEQVETDLEFPRLRDLIRKRVEANESELRPVHHGQHGGHGDRYRHRSRHRALPRRTTGAHGNPQPARARERAARFHDRPGRQAQLRLLAVAPAELGPRDLTPWPPLLKERGGTKRSLKPLSFRRGVGVRSSGQDLP